jgi:hypothetical protein
VPVRGTWKLAIWERIGSRFHLTNVIAIIVTDTDIHTMRSLPCLIR